MDKSQGSIPSYFNLEFPNVPQTYNFGHWTASESATIEQSIKLTRGLCNNLPPMLDVFLLLHYYTGIKTENSDIGIFRAESLCFNHYLQAPYTFRCAYELAVRGYYYESTILRRSLLENMVDMLYYTKNPLDYGKKEKKDKKKKKGLPGLVWVIFNSLSTVNVL